MVYFILPIILCKTYHTLIILKQNLETFKVNVVMNDWKAESNFCINFNKIENISDNYRLYTLFFL